MRYVFHVMRYAFLFKSPTLTGEGINDEILLARGEEIIRPHPNPLPDIRRDRP